MGKKFKKLWAQEKQKKRFKRLGCKKKNDLSLIEELEKRHFLLH